MNYVLDYARCGFLDPVADHTNGKYISVPPNKFWKEDFPLRGCIYLSRSLHQIGHTVSV